MAAALQGRMALVTGASSGLGVDFARELAQRGAGLILVARREEKLQALAEELRAQAGVDVHVVAQDLGTEHGPAQLAEQVRERGLTVDVLVNNAGFGVNGPWLETPWDRERSMLLLDIVAVADLTRRFLPGMVERGWGRVLQVASIGAYQATPTYASYAAAKAFVLHYGEAINAELSGTGASCTVISPGVTATEFLETAGQTPTLYQRMVMMKSPAVARVGVRAMLRGKSSVVPGLFNKLSAWSIRFVPRRLATWFAGRLMR